METTKMMERKMMAVKSPAEILRKYLEAKRVVTKEFIAGINFEAMHGLSDDVMYALTYMQNVEDAVWGVYLKEVASTPTGKNPYTATFLSYWEKEEATHAEVLKQILDSNGGPRKVPRGVPYDSSWVARLVGERYFGGIHMAFGATNERMTLLAYRALANRCGNAELKRVLEAIAKEEAIHYSFYVQMAQHYLANSFVARLITVRVLNIFAVGVGIGVMAKEAGHKVTKFLFDKARDDLIDGVEGTLSRKLPGFKSFKAMTRLANRAAIA